MPACYDCRTDFEPGHTCPSSFRWCDKGKHGTYNRNFICPMCMTEELLRLKGCIQNEIDAASDGGNPNIALVAIHGILKGYFVDANGVTVR